MLLRLDHMCAVNVAIQLIKRGCIDAIDQLPLPVRLKILIETVVERLERCIRIWSTNHEEIADSIATNVLQHISWTNRGSIDETATISSILGDENLNVLLRFQQACYYSMEEHIRDLWGRLSPSCEYKTGFENVEQFENAVLLFWLKVLLKIPITPESIEFALEDAIILQLKHSMWYFKRELSDLQVKNAIIRTATRLREMEPFPRPSTICFLVRNLPQEDTIDYLSSALENDLYACSKVLRALLYWKHIEMGHQLIRNGILKLMSDHEFFCFLMDSSAALDTEKTFELLWQHSTENQKNFTSQNWQLSKVLCNLLQCGNQRGAEQLTNYLENTTKSVNTMVFTSHSSNLIWQLAKKDNWACVEYFIFRWFPKSPNSLENFSKKLDFEHLKIEHLSTCEKLEDILAQWQLEHFGDTCS